MDVEPAPVDLAELRGYVEQRVRPAGRGQGPRAARRGRPRSCPPTIITDGRRLQQILRNLLSNAVKFTAHGSVALVMAPAAAAGAPGRPARRAAHGRLHRARHRHRHRPGQAGDDLRGVPAGRRHHQPQVRRHRAWACRSAGSWPGCSAARIDACRRGSARARSSRCTCPTCRPPARRRVAATRRAAELGPAERPTPIDRRRAPSPGTATRPVARRCAGSGPC